MALWQGLLILVAYFVLAVLGGLFLGRILSRRWPHPFFLKRETAAENRQEESKSGLDAEKRRWAEAELTRRVQAKRSAEDTLPPDSRVPQLPLKEEAGAKEAAVQAKRQAGEAMEAAKHARIEAVEKARRELDALLQAEANRLAREKTETEALEAAKHSRLEAVEKARGEAGRLAGQTAEHEVGEAAERVRLEALEKARREAERMAREKGEREIREAEERARLEAVEKARREVVRLAREKAEREIREAAERVRLEVVEKARQEAEAANKPRETVKSSGVLGEACLAEIRANLKIATSPLTGKPLPFRISTMDDNPGEFETLSPSLRSDLREAYTDMAMANNIVWLITDLGANSKDIETSYIKLCAKIAERLTKVLP